MLQIWLIIAILFFILEMMGPNFLIFWVGVGALITMVASIFVDSIIVELGIFSISSILLIFCTKSFTKKMTEKNTTVTNANACIGKQAIVTQEINPLKGNGQIRVETETWSAKSSTDEIIEKGEIVTILEINGVKAIVEKSKEKTTV